MQVARDTTSLRCSRSCGPSSKGVDVAICHLETPVAPPGTEPDGVLPDVRRSGGDGRRARARPASTAARWRRTTPWTRAPPAIDADARCVRCCRPRSRRNGARRRLKPAPATFDVNGVRSRTSPPRRTTTGCRSPNGSVAVQPHRSGADHRRSAAGPSCRRRRSPSCRCTGAPRAFPDVTAEQRRCRERRHGQRRRDLIVGHHAHVVQPIEQINGRWVVFGMGNMLSGMGDSTDCCGPARPRRDDGSSRHRRTARRHVRRRATAGQPDLPGADAVSHPLGLGALADPTAAWGSPAALLASLERTNAVVGAYVAPG